MAFSEALILSSFLKKYTVFILHAWAAKNRVTIWCDLPTNLTSTGAGTRENPPPINTQSCGSTDHIGLLLTKTFPHYICYCIIQAYLIIKIYLWNFNFYLISASMTPSAVRAWSLKQDTIYISTIYKLLQVTFFSVSWHNAGKLLASKFREHEPCLHRLTTAALLLLQMKFQNEFSNIFPFGLYYMARKPFLQVNWELKVNNGILKREKKEWC